MQHVKAHIVPAAADTSWMAVGGGVLVTMGVGALLTPLLTGYLDLSSTDLTGPSSAIPVVAGLALAAILGGYVAGRVAGRRTGWHGLMSGVLGLFLTGAYVLVTVLVQRSYLGIEGRFIPEFFPGILTRAQYHSEASLALGLVGLPVQIVAAWIGGLLAWPRSTVVVVAPRIVVAAPGPALAMPAGMKSEASSPV